MNTHVDHLKSHRSRRVLLGAVATTALLAVAGVATTQAWGQSTTTVAPTTVPTTAPAAPAAPAGGDRLTVAKDAVDVRVERQVAAIDRVSAKVATDANLTAAERLTESADLGTLKSGLVALKAKVDGESTIAAVKSDVKAARATAKSTTDIDVAALYVRATGATAYLDALRGRTASIQSKLDRLKASGADVTAAQAALNDIVAKVSDARGHLVGLDAALLSPQPASQAQIATATTALKAAQADVAAVRADARGLRQMIAAAKGKGKVNG